MQNFGKLSTCWIFPYPRNPKTKQLITLCPVLSFMGSVWHKVLCLQTVAGFWHNFCSKMQLDFQGRSLGPLIKMYKNIYYYRYTCTQLLSQMEMKRKSQASWAKYMKKTLILRFCEHCVSPYPFLPSHNHYLFLQTDTWAWLCSQIHWFKWTIIHLEFPYQGKTNSALCLWYLWSTQKLWKLSWSPVNRTKAQWLLCTVLP